MKKLSLINIFSLSFLLFLSVNVTSANLSVTGNYQFGLTVGGGFNIDPALSTAGTETFSFLDNRFLLSPEVIIDDNFRIDTDFVVLHNTSTNFSTPNYFGNVSGSGDVDFLVKQAYLEWRSDYGIMYVGRKAKSWGLGVLYDSGINPFDNYATVTDQLMFQAMIAHVSLTLGYEKLAESGNITNHNDDAERYEFTIEYKNPDQNLNVGLLYAHNSVQNSFTAPGTFVDGDPSFIGVNESYSVFGLYAKKSWDKFEAGIEFVSNSFDTLDSSNGGLLQLDYQPNEFGISLDFAYASGGVNAFNFHPNYKPMLLMYRHGLGDLNNNLYSWNKVGQPSGSTVGLGNGSMFAKLGMNYSLYNKKYLLGLNLGFAQLTELLGSSDKELGYEVDLYLTQKIYDNFNIVYAAGYFLPGASWATDPENPWAFEVRGQLKF